MNAVILAGGYGTRLMPLTKDTPKPMVKLIDKPVLEYTILLLRRHGIKDIAMTLGYLPDVIKNYFKDGKKWGVNITYFTENQPLGTAGSVKGARNFLDNDFLVISGDCYTEIDLSKAVAFHTTLGSPFTVVCQPKQNPVGYGVLETDITHKITAFVEKPTGIKSGLINTGIYVINKSVLDEIPDGFYDFGKQLLPRLVGRAYACADYSYWSDIGTLVSYYETNALLAKRLSVLV